MGILMISCSDEEKASLEQEASVAQVVGDWRMVGLTVNDGATKVTSAGFSVVSEYKILGDNFDYLVAISSDEINSEGSLDLIYSIKVGLVGQTEITKETTSVSTEGIPKEFLISTWQLKEGNSILVTNNDKIIEVRILSISDNEMTWQVDISQLQFLGFNIVPGFNNEGAIQNDNLTFEVKGSAILTLEK